MLRVCILSYSYLLYCREVWSGWSSAEARGGANRLYRYWRRTQCFWSSKTGL